MSDAPSNQLLREQGTEITYRPFSPLALLAFIFGLLSLLTIVSFAFLLVGIAGLAVGLVAMLGCAEGRARSGYNIARAGVFLAAAGLTMGLGHHFGRISWMGHVARRNAEQLIAYIENDQLEEAHSLALAYFMRPQPGTDLIAYYMSKDVPKGHQAPPVVDLNHWLSLHPPASMCKDELRGRHEYVGYQKHATTQLDEQVVLRYRYHPASPDIQPFEYDIDLKRTLVRPPTGAQWRAQLESVVVLTGNEKPVRETVTKFSLEPRKRYRSKNAPTGGSQPAGASQQGDGSAATNSGQ
jgi:hypothetical protein